MEKSKASTCTNKSIYCKYTRQNKAACPTATTESYLITAVVQSTQKEMLAEISNIFVQTDIKDKLNRDQTIMKIRKQLVETYMRFHQKSIKIMFERKEIKKSFMSN